MKNYNVLVREQDDQHRLPAQDRAGRARTRATASRWRAWPACPTEVIDRAKEILANLEEGELGDAGQPKLAQHRAAGKVAEDDPGQLSLFGG